ncbi:hypothetical protein Suden_0087 [Sulfurimonas denitrificans DSM 1251]|uniref:YtkA-like domain-containing protein n=1 Tax=Sulfurimonas denitrificans (strain ATCC 33889 / DSM 1251) TaxID=326298 RepID=Q30UG3_SULDN|nr:FixH family protein [Sulfurimonas denitrificans]ABB43368.1 hypothetical protein Suden_0087 [Sulfurimonas denitrificans DSM 1251]MDD3442280.1 FixH family protein [Sulfurimonas denitrificans]
MKLNNGRIWPYAISASIIFIFGACIATIVVTSSLPVQESDTYMMSYHDADAKANELIKAKIDFDKKYNIEYVTQTFTKDKSVIAYKISDKESNPVNNATIKVVLTRPSTLKNDQELNNPSVENGVYTFEPTTLSADGRWDIMAQVSVGETSRFYNIKTDTRGMNIVEY